MAWSADTSLLTADTTYSTADGYSGTLRGAPVYARIQGPRSVIDSSAVTFTASFYNSAWETTTPTNARYKVSDDAGNDIVAWTTLTPGTTASITVPATANVPTDESRRSQVRLLTVQADNGLSSQVTEAFVYTLTNLRSIA